MRLVHGLHGVKLVYGLHGVIIDGLETSNFTLHFYRRISLPVP